MPTTGLRINLEQLKAQLSGFEKYAPKMISEVIHDTGDAAFELSQELCPIGDTKNLKRSGYVDNTQPFISKLGYTVNYAVYVEYGVPKHERTSKTGKRFTHKGQPAAAFLRNGIYHTVLRYAEIAGAVFDKYAAKIMRSG